jgi:hypothetical protein
MTSLSSLVGPYPTCIVRLVLDEMFAAVIRSIRVTAAVSKFQNSHAAPIGVVFFVVIDW